MATKNVCSRLRPPFFFHLPLRQFRQELLQYFTDLSYFLKANRVYRCMYIRPFLSACFNVCVCKCACFFCHVYVHLYTCIYIYIMYKIDWIYESALISLVSSCFHYSIRFLIFFISFSLSSFYRTSIRLNIK